MNDEKEKLIEVLRNNAHGYQTYEEFADYLLANGVTITTPRQPRQPADLTGKCGSCLHAVPAPGAFGKSQCYVKRTNAEHMRLYYRRPITQVRQRTTKACKKYKPKEAHHG
jgi:hypothetical protein